MSVTPLHRNVFTRIRFWIRKYLVLDSISFELKQSLYSNLRLKSDADLADAVWKLNRVLLRLSGFYRGNQSRVIVFLLLFLNRNIDTRLSKISNKRIDELIDMGQLPESTRKLRNDPTCTLEEALPHIRPVDY